MCLFISYEKKRKQKQFKILLVCVRRYSSNLNSTEARNGKCVPVELDKRERSEDSFLSFSTKQIDKNDV